MKFNIFKEKKPPLIGIDISSSSIKMVELGSNGKGGYKLNGYVISPLSKELVTDGNINDLDKVSAAIKVAYKALGSREKLAALALPSSAVITKKVFLLASLSESEMEAQVESEATQYIPFSLDEVNLDFQVLGLSTKNPEEVEVLIAAAKKERIEDRVAAAEGAGLSVSVMDIESFATHAAYSLVASQLADAGENKVVMIVDVGAYVTNVNVLHNNTSVYNRDQPFGGINLSMEIQRKYGLSEEEAESSKRNGGLPDSYEEEVLDPFTQSVASEIARSIQFFTGSTQYPHVDHVVIAGGVASIPGIDVLIQERIQVNTTIANPFRDMEISGKLQQKAFADAPALLIACGLAMKGVTL